MGGDVMDFNAAFGVPIIIEMTGGSVALKRLSIYDYREWIADLEKQFQDRNLALIPANASENEKAKTRSGIMARKFSPDDLRDQVFTIDGMDRIFKLSFVKSLTPSRLSVTTKDAPDVAAAIAQAEEYIEASAEKEIEMNAVRLSGLFTEAHYNAIYGISGTPPNAIAGQAPASP